MPKQHNKQMTFSAVLFDFDGTLHDRASSLHSFLPWHAQFLSRRYASPVDPLIFTERFLDLDMNGYRPKEEVYPVLIDEFNLELSATELLEHYRFLSLTHTKEMEGATALLQALVQSEIKVGIVTNGYVDFQMDRICYLGFQAFASQILISEEERVKKPEAEIFLRAAARLGVETEECLFVGDHPINDVVGPREVGMQAVWFDNGEVEWTPVFPCTAKVTHLSELLPLLIPQVPLS